MAVKLLKKGGERITFTTDGRAAINVKATTINCKESELGCSCAQFAATEAVSVTINIEKSRPKNTKSNNMPIPDTPLQR